MDDQQDSLVKEEASEDIDEVEPVEAGNQATLLLSLEEMIKRHISSIEKIQIELKKHREMFADSFENSPVYKEHTEKLKEAQKAKKITRQEILKQPQMIQLAERIKTMREESKDLKLALSDYLVEFQRLSGLNEIQDENGDFREIINSAKAIKKATKKK